MDVASAQSALARTKRELVEAERESRECSSEIERFDAKETVTAADVATVENARRKLVRLRDRDLPESTAALAAAEEALAVAKREHDLALLAEVRAKLAPLRAKLDARLDALADDPRGAEEVAWNAAHDAAFVKDLHAEIAELQATHVRWSTTPTPTLTSDERDPGPGFPDGLDASGLALFQAIRKEVNDVLDARLQNLARIELVRQCEAAQVERERQAQEAQEAKNREEYSAWMRGFRLRTDGGITRYVYLPEQVKWMKKHAPDLCEKAKALAEEALRAGVPRFLAERAPDVIALVSAFYPRIAEEIEVVQARRGRIVQQPSHSHYGPEQDARDRGSQILVDHHPELLRED